MLTLSTQITLTGLMLIALAFCFPVVSDDPPDWVKLIAVSMLVSGAITFFGGIFTSIWF